MTYAEPPVRRNERIEPRWDGRMPPPVAPSRRPPAAPRPRSPYIVAHWRGEFPIWQSFWVGGALVGIALLIIETALLEWLKAHHLSLTSMLVLASVYAAARLTISVWQVVGILRSAALSASGWAVPVNILMVLAILGLVGSLPARIHELQALSHGATAQRRLSNFTLVPDPIAHAIVVKGNVGVGYADAVVEALNAHPDIHRLVLDSLGGDVDNAMQLHDYLAAHPGITAEVDHACVSACTVVFTGASERVVSVHGTLGFHQMHSMIDSRVSNDYVDNEQQRFKSILTTLGASPDFVRLAFAKQGDEFYSPDATALFANHIITGLRIDDRVFSAAQWRTEKFLYGFSLSPSSQPMGKALTLIREQSPGIYDAWVARDLQIEQEASRDHRLADYNVSLWHALHAARAAAMHTTAADHVRSFAIARRDMLMDISQQFSADACGRYLAGLSFIGGKQADAIYETNGQSYVGLLSDNDPARRIDVDWTLGTRELNRVRSHVAQTVPVQPGPDYHTQLCHQQVALLDELLLLSPAGSDMALRALFATPM
ncbi:hypothetical protein [Dyella silvae]|uniref:hypothetical protein n=1 Tax=Dyella silvae TaxID=2994424 RepID=UPI0022648A61|nr:hypothetical protein [Dyella silvae]